MKPAARFSEKKKTNYLDTGSHFLKLLVCGCVFEVRMKAGNGPCSFCADNKVYDADDDISEDDIGDDWVGESLSYRCCCCCINIM